MSDINSLIFTLCYFIISICKVSNTVGNTVLCKSFLCTHYTVWKLQKFSLMIFQQKFREINISVSRSHCKSISWNILKWERNVLFSTLCFNHIQQKVNILMLPDIRLSHLMFTRPIFSVYAWSLSLTSKVKSSAWWQTSMR